MRRGLGSKLLEEMLEDIEGAGGPAPRSAEDDRAPAVPEPAEGAGAPGDRGEAGAEARAGAGGDADGAAIAEVAEAADEEEPRPGSSGAGEGAGIVAAEAPPEPKPPEPAGSAGGPDAAGPDGDRAAVSHQPSSSNTLYAVMALVADLDLESLRIVQSEIEARIEEALSG